MGKRRCDAAYNSFFLLAADDIWLRAVGVAIKFQLLLHFSHTAHAEAAKEMAMGKRPTRMGNENGYGNWWSENENETENGAIFIDAQPGDLTIAIHLISKQETH